MGIESKHAYRFGFLKSEEWRGVRLEALARDQAACAVCGKKDWSNDVHHVKYRPRWTDTQPKDLVTLCRKHHDVVHTMMDKYPGFSKIRIVQMLSREFAEFWSTVHKIKKHGFKLRTPDQCWNYKLLVKAASKVPHLLT